MRVGPVGLYACTDTAFQLAAEIAALTHGHPSGYLSAGAFAYLIAAIVEGQDVESATLLALGELQKHPHHQECTQLLQQALDLASGSECVNTALSCLGQGWVG